MVMIYFFLFPAQQTFLLPPFQYMRVDHHLKVTFIQNNYDI